MMVHALSEAAEAFALRPAPPEMTVTSYAYDSDEKKLRPVIATDRDAKDKDTSKVTLRDVVQECKAQGIHAGIACKQDRSKEDFALCCLPDFKDCDLSPSTVTAIMHNAYQNLQLEHCENYEYSGSTLRAHLILPPSRPGQAATMLIINGGDSRGWIYQVADEKLKPLNELHGGKEEDKRLREYGFRGLYDRVVSRIGALASDDSGLAPTRGLGDKRFRAYGYSHRLDIKAVELHTATYHVVASDGSEYVTEDTLEKIFQKEVADSSAPHLIAHKIVERSRKDHKDQSNIDDVSAVVFKFDPRDPPARPVLMQINDGHSGREVAEAAYKNIKTCIEDETAAYLLQTNRMRKLEQTNKPLHTAIENIFKTSEEIANHHNIHAAYAMRKLMRETLAKTEERSPNWAELLEPMRSWQEMLTQLAAVYKAISIKSDNLQLYGYDFGVQLKEKHYHVHSYLDDINKFLVLITKNPADRPSKMRLANDYIKAILEYEQSDTHSRPAQLITAAIEVIRHLEAPETAAPSTVPAKAAAAPAAAPSTVPAKTAATPAAAPSTIPAKTAATPAAVPSTIPAKAAAAPAVPPAPAAATIVEKKPVAISMDRLFDAAKELAFRHYEDPCVAQILLNKVIISGTNPDAFNEADFKGTIGRISIRIRSQQASLKQIEQEITTLLLALAKASMALATNNPDVHRDVVGRMKADIANITKVIVEENGRVFGKSTAEVDQNHNVIDKDGNVLLIDNASGNFVHNGRNVRANLAIALPHFVTIADVRKLIQQDVALVTDVEEKRVPIAAVHATVFRAPAPTAPPPSVATPPPAAAGDEEKAIDTAFAACKALAFRHYADPKIAQEMLQTAIQYGATPDSNPHGMTIKPIKICTRKKSTVVIHGEFRAALTSLAEKCIVLSKKNNRSYQTVKERLYTDITRVTEVIYAENWQVFGRAIPVVRDYLLLDAKGNSVSINDAGYFLDIYEEADIRPKLTKELTIPPSAPTPFAPR